MAARMILICTSALLVQGAFSQCTAGFAAPWGLASPAGWNGLAAFGRAAPGLGGAYGAPGLAGGYGAGCGGVASTGGGLHVTSVSPIAPTGVTVVSENAYEGSLAAGGNLPFLGTVALEGVLPTVGAGAISYGCGDGAVRIVAEDGPIFTGIIAPETFAPASGLAASGIAGYGIGGNAGCGLTGPASYGLGGLGCGCGTIY